MNLSEKEEKDVYKRVVTVLVLGIFILPILFFFSPASSLIMDGIELINSLASLHPILSALLFVFFTAVTAMVTFVGIFPLVPSAIMLWGPQFTLVLVMIGWFVGDLGMYVLGRGTGGSSITKSSLYKKYKAIQESLKKTEFFIILLLRLALPSEMFGYALGVIKYKFSLYLLVTFLAELPFAILTVYGADAYLRGDIVTTGAIVIVGVIIIAVAAFIAKRR